MTSSIAAIARRLSISAGFFAMVAAVPMGASAAGEVGFRTSVGVSAGVAAGILRGGDASAGQSNPFSTLLKRSNAKAGSKSRVQRFAAAPDGRTFLLETGPRSARVQFLCAEGEARFACAIGADRPAEEIIELTAERGSRGDVLYWTASHKLVVRMTPIGNATVYWPGESEGRAATRREEGGPRLRLMPLTIAEASRRAAQAAALLKARHDLDVTFDLGTGVGAAPDAEVTTVPVLADAILRAGEALDMAAAEEKATARRITRVEFKPASDPRVVATGSELIVFYQPDGDADGRPSCAEVLAVIAAMS
jgi:hypothetical protein